MPPRSEVGLIVRSSEDYQVLWNEKHGLIALPNVDGHGETPNIYTIGNWFRYQFRYAIKSEDEYECGHIKKIAMALEYVPVKPRPTFFDGKILQVATTLERKIHSFNDLFLSYHDSVLGTVLFTNDKTLSTFTESNPTSLKIIAIYESGYEWLAPWIAVKFQDENGEWKKLANLPNNIRQLVDTLDGTNGWITENSLLVPLNVAPKIAFGHRNKTTDEQNHAMNTTRQMVEAEVVPNVRRLQQTYDEFNRLFAEKSRFGCISNEMKVKVDNAMFPVIKDCIIPINPSLQMVYEIQRDLLQIELFIMNAIEEIKIPSRVQLDVAPPTTTTKNDEVIDELENVRMQVAHLASSLQHAYENYERVLTRNKQAKQPVVISEETTIRIGESIEYILDSSQLENVPYEHLDQVRNWIAESVDFIEKETAKLNAAIDGNPSNRQPDNSSGNVSILMGTLHITDSEEERQIKVAELVNRLQLAHDNYNRALCRNEEAREPMYISNEMASRVKDATEHILNARQLNDVPSSHLDEFRNQVLQSLEVVKKATDEINRGIDFNPANRPAHTIPSNSVQLHAAPMGTTREMVKDEVAPNVRRLQHTYDEFNLLVEQKSRFGFISNELIETVNDVIFDVITDDFIPINVSMQMINQIKLNLSRKELVIMNAIEEILTTTEDDVDMKADKTEDENPLEPNGDCDGSQPDRK